MVSRNTLHIDGTMGAGAVERWSVGLTFGRNDGATLNTQTDLQDWVTACAALVTTTSLTITRGVMSTAAAITGLRGYYYPSTGPALFSAGATKVPPVDGSGTMVKPPQAAMVVSLITPIAGRSFRGRVYLPWLAGSMSATTLVGGIPGGMAAELAALFNAFENAAPGATKPNLSVYSRTQDVLTPVSTIRIGTAVDTQRRRRDGVVEQYQTAPL